MPRQRASFRHTALIFHVIPKCCCVKSPCLAKNPSLLGTFPIFKQNLKEKAWLNPAPGALVEKTQERVLNRTNGNFCKPRARWPGRNCTQALLILRAGNSAACGRSASPVKGGPGERRLGAPERCSSGAVPRWRFAYFAATGKVGRRPQAAKLPLRIQKVTHRRGEIPHD